MAYKRESHHILAGSLNYAAPPDLLPEGDALQLTNFRPDQTGALRSRLGHASAYSGLGDVRSLIKALGHRYAGSSALYRDGGSIASGFSGEPMGLVDFKRWLWVMDAGKRGKDDGSDFRQWHIDPPDAAPDVEPASEVTATVVSFDSSETWTVDPSGSDDFDSSEKQQGSDSLKIEAPDESAFTLQSSVTLDLSALGGSDASDDDKHRLWIFCSKFKRLETVTIDIDVNGGDFKEDYYTATIPRKALKRAGKGWFRFEIRKALLVDPLTKAPLLDKKDLPYFTRVGATTGKDWSTVAAVRIKVDVRAACTIRFDHWEVFGSLDGTIEGEDIQYYYTYVNDDGHESNPSPASPKKVFNKTGAELTLVDSDDEQVTGKHVYRTGGTLGAVYRVTAEPIANGTTDFTDTRSDDDLVRLGIQMETDNDAPPEGQVLAGPYFGRLIAAKGSRLYWSKQNKPYAFPGAAKDAGNWADVGDSGEEIVQMVMRPRMLTVYKENTIWRVDGDPDDTGLCEITRATLGLIGRNAVCMAGEVDYFQGKEGIYEFNGDTARKISAKLDPIFRGQTVTLASGVTVSPISDPSASALEFVNGRLYFSYDNQTTLVYDREHDNWARDSRGFGVLYYEGQNGKLLAGTSAGDVLELESGNTDGGASFTVTYQSRYFDDGAPDTEKTFEDLTLEIDTNGQTLTVTGFTNNGTANAIGTVSTSGRTRVVLQMNSGLGLTARNLSVRIAGAVTSPVVIFAATLNFYFEARQAKSFDSDEQSLGTHKIKIVREAKLDLENSADVTLTLKTDQPGEAMATRDTATVGAGTTRRMAHVVFDEEVLGYLVRLLLTASSFRLYGLWLLIQVVGTYLEGDEFWLSDPVDFGTERVKLLREIEVIYRGEGGDLTVETDLPGNALELRGTASFPAINGEQSVKVRCAADIKGRLYRVRFSPAGATRIEAIRLRIKMIGEPNATPWVWVDLPVEKTQDAAWVAVPLPVDDIG